MAAQRAVVRLVGAALLAAGCFVGVARGVGAPVGGTGTALYQLRFVVRYTHLADESGRTVYVWLGDRPGTSSCAAQCALYWPPVLVDHAPIASDGAQPRLLSMIRRPDGTWQATYGGHPLYYYNADVDIGDTYGQGRLSFGAPWYELRPDGSTIIAR